LVSKIFQNFLQIGAKLSKFFVRANFSDWLYYSDWFRGLVFFSCLPISKLVFQKLIPPPSPPADTPPTTAITPTIIFLCFSLSQVIFVLLAYFLGFLPFVPLPDSVYETAYPSATLIAYVQSPAKTSFARRCFVNFARYALTRRWMFEHLQARGIRVIVFSLNEKKEFRHAFNHLGVDGKCVCVLSCGLLWCVVLCCVVLCCVVLCCVSAFLCLCL